jgi:hypothetical protein
MGRVGPGIAQVTRTEDRMNDTWRYRDAAWSRGGDVVGYEVEGTDGSIGKVDRATADTDAAYLVVDTGPWLVGKKRLIPAGLVTNVDHDAGTVTVTLSKDQAKAGPDYEEGVNPDEVTMSEHSDYYGPFSWWKIGP